MPGVRRFVLYSRVASTWNCLSNLAAQPQLPLSLLASEPRLHNRDEGGEEEEDRRWGYVRLGGGLEVGVPPFPPPSWFEEGRGEPEAPPLLRLGGGGKRDRRGVPP
ncbi:hypothetical protein Taro_032284, partial [Colocasia esculenta]|nr:hypothetical protein [Colocasia esculenta]